jgi:hypothetical protein
MLFFHMVLFFFFTVQSSDRRIVESDRTNPYGGKSFPSDYKKIRICFNRPDFLLNGSQTITITPDQKVFEDQNALNSIIHTYLVKNNIPQYGIVYLDIPSITDICSTECSILESRKAIEVIEKIKELNTKVAFTIKNKQLKEPFKFSENSDAYIKVHREGIFCHIQIEAIGFGTASTLIRTLFHLFLPSQQISPFLPIFACLTPYLFNGKYVGYCAKNIITDQNLSRLGKLVSISLYFLLFPIIICGINRFI